MQDAAACLLRDGEVVAAVEEERLTREKHTGAFPENAIRWCLEEAGASARDLDAVAFNMRPWEGLGGRLRQLASGLPRSLSMAGSRGGGWLRMMAVRQRFVATFGSGSYRWRWVRHHDAHAASAFLPSPFERAAVLVVDGSGELASATWYRAEGSRLQPLGSVPFPHSLGYFYSALTEYLGFRPAVAEGKTMGLSSYGEVDHGLLGQFRAMIADDCTIDARWFRYQDGGARYYGPPWITALGPPRAPESDLVDRHYAVAAAGQRRLEEVLLALIDRVHAETGLEDLCLAGGVALNCVANGRITRETPFRRLFVQPVAHDAGTAFGAALHVHGVEGGGRRVGPQQTVAWGPRYASTAIDAALSAAGLRGHVVGDRAATAAELVAAGSVVGWFQGRCEMGPRALGHRSILADPRDPAMPGRVNAQVKRREGFRPFAPAVLAERASEWFDGTPTPFMTTVHRVLRDDVPAITHVDGTARVQVVSAEHQPGFHRLLKAFEARTGVPMVLNTSFNVRGEPIVCTPDEALNDYRTTALDALLLEDRLVSSPPGAERATDFTA